MYLRGEPVALLEYETQPGWYFYVIDHLGTPQQLVDAQGTVVWQAAYLPYGEAKVLKATVQNNLRFPGQYFDTETGLHYNWNRYYNPKTGRYITADPIGLAGGMNLYAYVGGNPVNAVDVEGLEAVSIAIGAGGFASGLGTGTPVIVGSTIPVLAIAGVGVGAYAITSWAIQGTWLGNGELGDLVYDLVHKPVMMAKGGKQSPQNWATEQAKYEAMRLNIDPCDVLDRMLNEAKCKGDEKVVQDIIQAKKFLKCRNIQKRKSR